MEATIPTLRAQDPERLFDLFETFIANGYAEKLGAE
jgi:hypothetical protein